MSGSFRSREYHIKYGLRHRQGRTSKLNWQEPKLKGKWKVILDPAAGLSRSLRAKGKGEESGGKPGFSARGQ